MKKGFSVILKSKEELGKIMRSAQEQNNDPIAANVIDIIDSGFFFSSLACRLSCRPFTLFIGYKKHGNKTSFKVDQTWWEIRTQGIRGYNWCLSGYVGGKEIRLTSTSVSLYDFTFHSYVGQEESGLIQDFIY